jgi:hypothetical protein
MDPDERSRTVATDPKIVVRATAPIFTPERPAAEDRGLRPKLRPGDCFRVSQGLAARIPARERGLRPCAYLRGWFRSDRLVSRLVSRAYMTSLEVRPTYAWESGACRYGLPAADRC